MEAAAIASFPLCKTSLVGGGVQRAGRPRVAKNAEARFRPQVRVQESCRQRPRRRGAGHQARLFDADEAWCVRLRDPLLAAGDAGGIDDFGGGEAAEDVVMRKVRESMMQVRERG